jgi:hypothetical protein
VAQPSNLDSFLVNHHKPRGLGVASVPIPLMTWPLHRPGSVLVLWPNQQTVVLGFVEKPRKPCMQASASPPSIGPAKPFTFGSRTIYSVLPRSMTWLLPCTSSTLVLRLNQETVLDFVLLFLPPCSPHLIPFGHRVYQVESTCLSTPQRPHGLRPFAPTLHLFQRKSSRNLHLQYSANSESTPRCQSLITPRSDHPLVLGRSNPQGLVPLVRISNICKC